MCNFPLDTIEGQLFLDTFFLTELDSQLLQNSAAFIIQRHKSHNAVRFVIKFPPPASYHDFYSNSS